MFKSLLHWFSLWSLGMGLCGVLYNGLMKCSDASPLFWIILSLIIWIIEFKLFEFETKIRSRETYNALKKAFGHNMKAVDPNDTNRNDTDKKIS